MSSSLKAKLRFLSIKDQDSPCLCLELLFNNEEIPLSSSSFLLYLYNHEDELGEALLDFCYKLAKVLRPIRLQNKAYYALCEHKQVVWFLKHMMQLKVGASLLIDNQKKQLQFLKKLPFDVRLIQYNNYLRAKFVQRDLCLNENARWLFFMDQKDSVLCWDEKIILNPSKIALGFLEQFQNQDELVFDFDVAQQFVRTVYNHSKTALNWKITGNLDVFLPKQVTPIPLLKVNYEKPILSMALYFKYGNTSVAFTDSIKQLKDKKKRTVYDRCMDIEETFQQFLMQVFIDRDIPFILEQPGDILRFFNEIVPDLEQRGWKIDNQSKDFKIAKEIADPKVVLQETGGWFSFQQSVDVGGEQFSFQEFARLMVENQGYVPMKKGGFMKVSEETRQDVENLASKNLLAKTQFSKADMLGLLHQTQCIRGKTEEVQNTIDSYQKLHENKNLNFSKLKGELRDYQHYGVSWLSFLYQGGFGGILADDMGLGKTIQCLSFILQLEKGSKHLIVGPASVIYNWEAEIKKFVPHLKSQIYSGKQRFEDLVKKLDKTDIIITSFGVMKRDVDVLKDIPFETMIIDEGQNIKNSQTQISKAIKRINRKFCLVMSGTPIENHLFDLWNLFEVSMPQFLGTKTVFENMIKSDQKEHLKAKIKPFVLRRVKEEVLSSLPEKQEVVITTPMLEEQASIYKTVLKAAQSGIKTASGKRERLNMLTALLKLRQACVDASLIKEFSNREIPSAKIELAKQKLIEIIDQGHKVVVFSQFKTLLMRLHKWVEDQHIYCEFLHGEILPKERMKRIDRFQTEERAGVFLISLKAGGVGINLTAADYVFHLDPWWNPAVEAQATDRVHRMGQTNKVMVYKFISEDTVEEKIQKLQQEKQSLLAEMVDIESDGQKSFDMKAIESLIL